MFSKLYTRGRHANITTVCSLHRARGILQPVVRSQLTGILFFRQRSALELQAFLEENGGILPARQDMERIYRIATEHPYQFLYVDLRSTDPNNTFYIRFSQRIRVNSASSKNDVSRSEELPETRPSTPAAKGGLREAGRNRPENASTNVEISQLAS